MRFCPCHRGELSWQFGYFILVINLFKIMETIILVESQKEYNKLMEYLQNKRVKWSSGNEPTAFPKYWEEHERNNKLYIVLHEGNLITWRTLNDYNSLPTGEKNIIPLKCYLSPQRPPTKKEMLKSIKENLI